MLAALSISVEISSAIWLAADVAAPEPFLPSGSFGFIVCFVSLACLFRVSLEAQEALERKENRETRCAFQSSQYLNGQICTHSKEVPLSVPFLAGKSWPRWSHRREGKAHCSWGREENCVYFLITNKMKDQGTNFGDVSEKLVSL